MAEDKYKIPESTTPQQRRGLVNASRQARGMAPMPNADQLRQRQRYGLGVSTQTTTLPSMGAKQASQQLDPSTGKMEWKTQSMSAQPQTLDAANNVANPPPTLRAAVTNTSPSAKPQPESPNYSYDPSADEGTDKIPSLVTQPAQGMQARDLAYQSQRAKMYQAPGGLALQTRYPDQDKHIPPATTAQAVQQDEAAAKAEEEKAQTELEARRKAQEEFAYEQIGAEDYKNKQPYYDDQGNLVGVAASNEGTFANKGAVSVYSPAQPEISDAQESIDRLIASRGVGGTDVGSLQQADQAQSKLFELMNTPANTLEDIHTRKLARHMYDKLVDLKQSSMQQESDRYTADRGYQAKTDAARIAAQAELAKYDATQASPTKRAELSKKETEAQSANRELRSKSISQSLEGYGVTDKEANAAMTGRVMAKVDRSIGALDKLGVHYTDAHTQALADAEYSVAEIADFATRYWGGDQDTITAFKDWVFDFSNKPDNLVDQFSSMVGKPYGDDNINVYYGNTDSEIEEIDNITNTPYAQGLLKGAEAMGALYRGGYKPGANHRVVAQSDAVKANPLAQLILAAYSPEELAFLWEHRGKPDMQRKVALYAGGDPRTVSGWFIK